MTPYDGLASTATKVYTTLTKFQLIGSLCEVHLKYLNEMKYNKKFKRQ